MSCPLGRQEGRRRRAAIQANKPVRTFSNPTPQVPPGLGIGSVWMISKGSSVSHTRPIQRFLGLKPSPTPRSRYRQGLRFAEIKPDDELGRVGLTKVGCL
jgi:hypothetical protein